MKAITFLLTTKEPVLATSFSGDPNSDVSYPYIPGSAIRGALIARHLKESKKEDILTDEKVRRLFFDGTTRYLNAYLYAKEKQKRTFPMLASWKKEKGVELKEDEEIEIYDFSEDKPELESPKSVGEYYWVEEDEDIVELHSVSRRINIHNMRDRRKGRSTKAEKKGEGEIFTYDAIDANQTFQGVILCDDGDEQTIQDLLNESNTIRLGGSISAGYGRTEISKVDSSSAWNEVGISAEDRASNTLKITLLSDLIFRDEWGQYVAMPPTNLLEEFLGKELKIDLAKTYMSTALIGGFNRKWGLPLPQVQAVAAGSVFVYENVDISSEKIAGLEAAGIGERTVEGFGRLAVNWGLDVTIFDGKLPKKVEYSKRKQPKLKEDNEEEESEREESEEEKIAKKMAERILRKRLEKFILDKVQANKIEPNGTSNSQISRLMLVARKCLEKKSAGLLTDLLKDKKAQKQYENARIKNQPLKKQIEAWLDKPKEWFIENNSDLENVKIADVPAQLEPLALEYMLRLIMAIAKNAIKETQEKEEKND